MELKSIILDFDGVIADSNDIKTKAFGKLFDEYGDSVKNKVMDYHVQHGGVSRYKKIPYYYENYLNKKLTEEEYASICDQYSHLVVNDVVQCPFMPGAEEFLNKYSRTYSMFVVSGTPENEMRQIIRLRQMDEHFVDVLGSPCDKIENTKKIIDKYMIKPETAIFIGDAKSDYEGAVQNNIRFIAFINDLQSPLNHIDHINKYKNFSDFHSNIEELLKDIKDE